MLRCGFEREVTLGNSSKLFLDFSGSIFSVEIDVTELTDCQSLVKTVIRYGCCVGGCAKVGKTVLNLKNLLFQVKPCFKA